MDSGLNFQRLLFHVQMSQHQQVHVQTILESRHLQLLLAVVLNATVSVFFKVEYSIDSGSNWVTLKSDEEVHGEYF